VSHRQRNRAAALFAGCLVMTSACGSAHAKSAPLALQAPASPVIAAGGRYSVELQPSGRLLTWGDNATGELGDGSAVENRIIPMAVPAFGQGTKIVAIATGSNHVLALVSDGTVWAWGHNRSGQLGSGNQNDQLQPVHVAGLTNVRALATGDAFSMALRDDGSVVAWGNNHSGQLGDGNAPIDHTSPGTVHGLPKGSGVIAIAAGMSQALVLKRDGSVWAWGNGTSGELGDGANDKRSAPTQVIGLGPGSGVVAIASGGSHALALKNDGSVVAWGNNKSGQLGNGRMPTDSSRPVPVKGLGPGSGVIAIAAGESFSVALKKDGTVLAWGRNKVGDLGDGTRIDRSTPVAVKELGPRSGVVAVTAGSFHALALKQNGTVVAWGDNSSGQVGDGNVCPKRPLPPTSKCYSLVPVAVKQTN
jgi:alpha-tubulin suppressor-like RCC1 family protein